jgi:integrase
MRTTKPHVKRWKWGGPNSAWVIEGMRNADGKRVRKFFHARDAANQWLAQRRPELKNQGRAAIGMTDGQRVDAVGALKLLAPYGATLLQAAKSFADRAKLLAKTVTFGELRAEVIKAKKADKCSDAYIHDLTNRLARFGRSFDARPCALIEGREIDDFLRALGLSPTSRNNYRRVLHSTFAYAIGRSYAAENPVSKIAPVKATPAAKEILTPIEITALLTEADAEIVASLAIGAFAGLRDAEIGRLTWEHVDLTGGHIKLDAAITKTAGRRIVPISPNLTRWLAPLAKKSGTVRGCDYGHYNRLCRKARSDACKLLKKSKEPCSNLQPWANNGLRHSYVSYRMAVNGNPATVAEECGHSVAVMRSNYRELRTKAEGEAWFAVMPPAAYGNVLAFSAQDRTG